MTKSFAPGVWITDDYGNRKLVTPTGLEWVMAFALAGCQWAIDALPQAIERAEAVEVAKSLGGGI